MCNGSVKNNRKYYDNQTIAKHKKGHINEKYAKTSRRVLTIFWLSRQRLHQTAQQCIFVAADPESTLRCDLFKMYTTTLQVIFIENTRPYH